MTRPLIALDIDGTILRHDQTMSEVVRTTIREATEHADVVLATGRALADTMRVVKHIGLTHGFAVCANGAVIIALDPTEPAGYRLLDAVTFDPEPPLRALFAAHPSAVACVEELGHGFKVSAPFPEGELMAPQRVVPFDELVAEPTTSVAFRCTTSTREDFLELVRLTSTPGVDVTVGYTAWLDLRPHGINKATGLQSVLARMPEPPSQTIAVGDQYNDLEMLAWVDRGVAMGQAPDEVKAAADEVTGTIDEDGTVAVLRSVMAGPRASSSRTKVSTGPRM